MDTWAHSGFNTTHNRSLDNSLTNPFGTNGASIVADFQSSIVKDTWRPNQLMQSKQQSPILVKQEQPNSKGI
jgi:hypothetical protein